MQWIAEAVSNGARQSKACAIIGLTARTLQRWRASKNNTDGRQTRQQAPVNQLSEFEKQRILKICNEAEYEHLSPNQIVPALADKGIYVASESSFYRVLKAAKQLSHRMRSKPNRKIKPPKPLEATGPNQIYCWDITYLPSSVRGMFYYLYMVMDVYSRKVVGWQVHDRESNELAADMMTDICIRENIKRDQVVLHSDNGGPMKGATMLATLQQLGVVPSFSRPAVSNDNPYSESLFRTLKYRPEYPEKPFDSLVAAREWVAGFVQWYNREHRHSGIKYVTPEERHSGKDKALLEKRNKVYEAAKAKNPERWPKETRDWSHQSSVPLNPEKQKTEKSNIKAA